MFRDGRLTECNDAMARMYGLTRAEELVGKKVSDLLIESEEGNWKYLRAFASNGYRLQGVESIELAVDGSKRRFVNGLVGVVRNGMLISAFGTQSDVTARAQLELQARHADTVAALNRLAGGVAHDFNNLLTTILTSVDILEDTLDDAHIAREDAAEIRRAARRGADLTRQLLALSQQQVLVPRPVDLNVILRRAVSAIRRGQTVFAEVRDRPWSEPAIAAVDPEEFEQVLVTVAGHLLESVDTDGFLEFGVELIHAAEARSGLPDSLAAGTWVAVTVADSAPAWSPREAAHLFEPFFGVALAESATGMALATMRGFVHQSGGVVLLHAEGSGRRFGMYFPAAPSAGVNEPRTDRSAPSSGTVLLAEDEPTVRLLMKRVLQRAGFAVLVAADGDEALDLSREYSGHIDLLVTDVIMPGMGGGELSRRLREERPGLRVLHVSGYTAGALRQNEALEDGAAFLQKPFTPKSLVSRVVEVLGDRVVG